MLRRVLLAALTSFRFVSLSFACALVFCPTFAAAGPFFEDGFLGLKQSELRAKLGAPYAVREAKSALRAYNYYPLKDWEEYYKKVVSPERGEDVYKFKRDGTDVRYSFRYVTDLNEMADLPTLYVGLVDIEFSPPVPVEQLPSLVPEFRPPMEPDAPAFRSNIWLLIFKGVPSPAARLIVREPSKDRLDWTLAYQLFSLQGLPEYLTLQAKIDRMEISAQSIEFVRRRQRLTHEPTLNPFSKEFASRPAPQPPTKKIPVPKYAD